MGFENADLKSPNENKDGTITLPATEKTELPSHFTGFMLVIFSLEGKIILFCFVQITEFNSISLKNQIITYIISRQLRARLNCFKR